MTDLVTTGPEMIDLRFGQTTVDLGDGRVERSFSPRAHHAAERGYLHPGVAAAAMIEAARTCVGLPLPLTSVAAQFDRLIPLGQDLRAVVDDRRGGLVEVELRVIEDEGWDAEPVGVLARGQVRSGDPVPLHDEGELRSFAAVPVPEPEAHDAHAHCFVCGQDNAQGLDLLPGWYAPDTVVTGFTAGERLGENGVLAPAAAPALLLCPTLWGNREYLDELDAPGAIVTGLEVRFHDDLRVPSAVRSVGQAGARGKSRTEAPDVGEADERRLRGGSALVSEDGRVVATAQASWQAVDELPEREPGGIPPLDEFMPLKGGRPEDHSPEDWGRSLPGRREAAGPRSQRIDELQRRG